MTDVEGAWFNDVFFTEAPCQGQRLHGGRINVEISRQNSNLRTVKAKLAAKVRKQGGNGLVGFSYGQKSHGILEQLFTLKWDSESWHGSGYAAKLVISDED